MDPQSQSFTPYGGGGGETWRLQNDVARLQQVQAEHSDRIARLERRQDEDARVRSVWGTQSPFPGALSTGAGSTPNQGPVNAPPSDHFRNFDDEANSLMNSLTNLDVEDEPRRGLGAASRANSVRFDETANQNHFTHSSRPSAEFLSRSSSGGLGSLQMNERSLSHKSEGRASSAHSMRSAASGRANSLNMDSTYAAANDSRDSPDEQPAVAPGLFWLGPTPAIIRCWMNMSFRHDALLYVAICSGSHKSWIDSRLVNKLQYDGLARPSNENGFRSIRLPIFFAEATTTDSRTLWTNYDTGNAGPRIPNVNVDFHISEADNTDPEEAIGIFLGSDMLRNHSADILFSNQSVTLFDDERHKLSIPMIRPDKDDLFKNLYVANMKRFAHKFNAPAAANEDTGVNGQAQGSSAASVGSEAPSPQPAGKYRPPGAVTAEASNNDSSKGGAGLSSDPDARPTSRQSNASRPSLNLNTGRTDTQDSTAQPSDAAASSASVRSGSSPATWGSWRSTSNTAGFTPMMTSNGTDWATSSRTRDSSYQRKDTGMKVLKPKTANRTFSSTASPATAAPGDGGAKGSRFFDDGRRKSEVGSVGDRKENEGFGAIGAGGPGSGEKKKANPIGTGSAFSWLNGPK